MNFKKDVVSILKEFEQNDYTKGGVSISPESYEAIADKIYRDLHDKYWFKCLEHYCQENDAIIRYLFDGNKISEVWVKIDGESSWTVFGYNDFLKGVGFAELFYGEHKDAGFFTLAIPTVNKTIGCTEQWHELSVNMGDGACIKCGKDLNYLLNKSSGI